MRRWQAQSAIFRKMNGSHELTPTELKLVSLALDIFYALEDEHAMGEMVALFESVVKLDPSWADDALPAIVRSVEATAIGAVPLFGRFPCCGGDGPMTDDP